MYYHKNRLTLEVRRFSLRLSFYNVLPVPGTGGFQGFGEVGFGAGEDGELAGVFRGFRQGYGGDGHHIADTVRQHQALIPGLNQALYPVGFLCKHLNELG